MIKLVTFNIRCDYDQDGANSFRFRKPVILKKLAEEKPDVICFQEVLPHVAAWLKENLTEYTVVGCGRNEILEDEQMTVAFRTDRHLPVPEILGFLIIGAFLGQYGNILVVSDTVCAGKQIRGTVHLSACVHGSGTGRSSGEESLPSM